MSATYEQTLDTDKDKVRFALGDVADPWLLTDEEINATLTAAGSVAECTRRCCIAIIGKLSRSGASTSLGPFSVSKGELVSHYRSLLDTLEQERSRTVNASPYLAGLVEADRTAESSSGTYTVARFTEEEMPT